MIYFIQSKSDGRVKIGSSSDPEARLKQLQTGSSAELILIGKLPGSVDEERALHKRFAEHKTDGEWFFPAKEIFDFINNPIGELLKSSGKKMANLDDREVPSDYASSAGAKCDCGGYDFGPYLSGEAPLWVGQGYHNENCPILSLACDPEHSMIVDGEPILYSTVINLGGDPAEEQIPWEPDKIEEVANWLKQREAA